MSVSISSVASQLNERSMTMSKRTFLPGSNHERRFLAARGAADDSSDMVANDFKQHSNKQSHTIFSNIGDKHFSAYGKILFIDTISGRYFTPTNKSVNLLRDCQVW